MPSSLARLAICSRLRAPSVAASLAASRSELSFSSSLTLCTNTSRFPEGWKSLTDAGPRYPTFTRLGHPLTLSLILLSTPLGLRQEDGIRRYRHDSCLWKAGRRFAIVLRSLRSAWTFSGLGRGRAFAAGLRVWEGRATVGLPDFRRTLVGGVFARGFVAFFLLAPFLIDINSVEEYALVLSSHLGGLLDVGGGLTYIFDGDSSHNDVVPFHIHLATANDLGCAR